MCMSICLNANVSIYSNVNANAIFLDPVFESPSSASILVMHLKNPFGLISDVIFVCYI